jgi:hypothetical protein
MTLKKVLEKIDQWQRRKARAEILSRLSEQTFELVSAFKEASRKFIIIFSAHKAV